MPMTSETAPAGHVERSTATEADGPRFHWSPPQVRRLATSSAEGSTGLGPDAELIS